MKKYQLFVAMLFVSFCCAGPAYTEMDEGEFKVKLRRDIKDKLNRVDELQIVRELMQKRPRFNPERQKFDEVLDVLDRLHDEYCLVKGDGYYWDAAQWQKNVAFLYKKMLRFDRCYRKHKKK